MLDVALLYTDKDMNNPNFLHQMEHSTISWNNTGRTMLYGRRKLIEMSKAEYIWFIDADDIVLETPKDYEGWDITFYNGNRQAQWSRVVRRELLVDLPNRNLNYLEDAFTYYWLMRKNPTTHEVKQPIYKYTGKHHNIEPWEVAAYRKSLYDLTHNK